MLTVILTSAAAIGTVAVPAALWLTLQAPAVQPVAPTAGAATTAAVAPAPTAVQPEAGAVLRGRISGPVAQVLARLRRDGGLDVRDRTWLDEGRPRLVDVDAGIGLGARAVLARMADQAGLTIEPGPAGQMVVGVAPLPAAVEQALERPVTLDAREWPLRKCLDAIGQQTGLPMLASLELGADLPVTLRVNTMRCGDALKWIAQISNLAWSASPQGVTMVALVPDGPAVLAVEPEGAQLRRFLRLGPADFLRRALPEASWKGGAPSALRLPDGSDLLELPAGGPDSALARALLRGLSRHRGSDPWDFVEGLHHERQQLIDGWKVEALKEERLLASPLDLDLRDASLEDALVAVRAQTKLNVIVLPELLASERKILITITGTGIPLRQVLVELRQIGLACKWHSEALVFSSVEDAGAAPAGGPQGERSPLSGIAQPSPLDLPHRPGPAGAG